MRIALLSIFFISILYSCSDSANEKTTACNFEIKDFYAATNYLPDKKIKTIQFDYSSAIDSGFVIPSVKQTSDGYFEFEFSLKNNSGKDDEYFYKIYYQNESYKFTEFVRKKNGPKYNPYAQENFYGSWEDTDIDFKPTGKISDDGKFHKIKDKIRIVGNPRNEKKFFGTEKKEPTEEEIREVISRINNSPDWLNSIRQKAKNNKISLENQLRTDAVFVLKEGANNTINNRWKRNPRVGEYSFMIVVIDKKNYMRRSIPMYIENISEQFNGEFINPYYYFLYGDGKKTANSAVLISANRIKAYAQPDLSSGIYIDPDITAEPEYKKNYFNDNCGNNINIYQNAHFQQFFQSLKDADKINNIPLTENIFVSDYTRSKYEENSKKYSEKERISTHIYNTDCPCKTVNSVAEGKKIVMFNPASDPEKHIKENVGVKSRHGFTYGKFRVKAKMTELLNKDNVWNGITNAIWLVFQNGDWNLRRPCNKGGYIPKALSGPNPERKPALPYSEIDIEIVKTSKDWPENSYKNAPFRPEYNDKSDDIIFICSNWDMACKEPEFYGIGAGKIKYLDKEFVLHRWDDVYKALQIKTPLNEKEVSESDYYYYEIEWKPEEIIWRAGPEPDKMKIIGYMNKTVTSIPNNQMLLVLTQKFHLADWWPLTPFRQENIPFPTNNYTGEIYEITIE